MISHGASKPPGNLPKETVYQDEAGKEKTRMLASHHYWRLQGQGGPFSVLSWALALFVDDMSTPSKKASKESPTSFKFHVGIEGSFPVGAAAQVDLMLEVLRGERGPPEVQD